jgi:Cd2+/Zn2+-exporting ATPase
MSITSSVHTPAPDSPESTAPPDRGPPFDPFAPRSALMGAILAGVLLAGGVGLGFGGAPAIGSGLVWASLAIGMVYGVRAAARALRALSVNIDVLMAVGAGLAAWIGHPAEGALLLVLFTASGALEALAMERTKREIKALHRLMPKRAEVWEGGGWAECAPESLAPGERIRIRAGEIVPADAVITLGESAIDQATLTGESMPRSVAPGDEVFAGTINTGNPIEARVVRPASESSLQRILNLVTQAQQQREPFQRLIDRLSEPYAVGVFIASAAIMTVWATLLHFPFRDAAYTAITFLIVASPCALIIATPTATLAAISRAARAGILFKGGQAIDRLANMGAVCFDKTGTLTIGRPKLERVILPEAVGGDEAEALAVAAGLEEGSTHPLATAVMEAARARKLPTADVNTITNVPGRGVSGRYAGAEARLGNLAHTGPLLTPDIQAGVQRALDQIRQHGKLGTVLAWTPDGQTAVRAAVLVMSDQPRAGAAELVAQLHTLGVRPVRMLTGDNPVTARHVAEALGIDRWDAELLPEHKVAAVKAQKKETARGRHRGVGVIGDGVNDAPALAAADVAIGIGSIGSDAALEAADIVLLTDDLASVPWGLRLARRTRLTVKANIALALSIIAAMGVATLVSSLLRRPIPLSIGVIAHEGGTVVVVLNSLRLLAFPAGRRAPAPPARDRPRIDPPVLGGQVEELSSVGGRESAE